MDREDLYFIRKDMLGCDELDEDLSQEQEKFFSNSKIRDDKGNLLVCYHGTENPGFKEFDARKGKSQFGDYKFDNYNINYFTTNKETAIGYTDLGYEHDNNVYACYLNIVNPYIVNNETKDDMMRTWHNIKDRKIRDKEILYFERFYDKWKSSKKDLDAINKDMFFFNCKFVRNEDDEEYYDLISLNNNTMFGSSHPLLYAYSLEEYFDDDMYEELRDALVGDYQGEDKEYFNYTIDNLIRWVLLMNEEDGTNYDGIIIPEIYDVGPKGSPFMTGKTTDIVTLKSSNQIKRIDNLKPTSSSNIDEDLNDKTLRFPKDKVERLIDTLKDTYKNIHVETLPIDKLVKDNDLLNDDDLESYHERIWNNAKAKDFHIDKSKIDSISAIGIPFVTKKKDGRLLLSDGRHRTRAAYNDGYKFVEYPIYVEESLINEKIVKKGSKWQVQSEKGRNMGTYDTKEEAEKRLQQVHYFKHMNESNYSGQTSLRQMLEYIASMICDEYDPNESYCVHHLDNNHSNNNLENIALMKTNRHKSYHTRLALKNKKDNYKGFNPKDYEDDIIPVGKMLLDVVYRDGAEVEESLKECYNNLNSLLKEDVEIKGDEFSFTLDDICNKYPDLVSSSYESCGPAFIMPNGKYLLSGKRFDMHADFAFQCLMDIEELSEQEIENEFDTSNLTNFFTRFFKLIRVNDGSKGDIEDRAYFVIPYRSITSSQMNSLQDFVDYIIKNKYSKKIYDIQAFVGTNYAHQKWDLQFNNPTSNEIIEDVKFAMSRGFFGESLNESKEDQQRFIDKFGQDIYDLFIKSKDRLKNANISTDMVWHTKNTSVEDLKNILYNLRSKVNTKTSDKDSNDLTKVPGKYKYLGNKDGYDVYEPLDVEASMALGVGSGWCTTGRYGHAGDVNFKPSVRDAETHWNQYMSKDIRLFYFLQNGIGKYAIALYPKVHNVSQVINNDYYLDKCNFELYNQEDKLDYSAIDKLPIDLIPEELVVDYKKVEDNLVLSDDKKTVIACAKDVKSIVIPDGVTTIGKGAFYGCYDLSSVKIPNSIITIMKNAFANCEALVSITIPNSVTIIDDASFSWTGLKSITIPTSVTRIGRGAFNMCDDLEEITIPFIGESATSNQFFGYIFGQSHYNTDFSQTGAKSIKRVVITGDITSIPKGAFLGCSTIHTIKIPESVTEIGQYAFLDCSNLWYLTLSNNVTKIDDGAFFGCDELIIKTTNDYVKKYCKENGIECVGNRALTEDINKYYRLELEDEFGDRAGLWTGAFELIPTKETIEDNPEDYVDLTPDERRKYYQFDYLLDELSKIKSPGVDTNLNGFGENDIFAFTSNKYKEVKGIIEEMRHILRELGFKLIVKEVNVDDKEISYKDDDQIAFHKEESSRELDEDLKNNILDVVEKEVGTSDRPVDGPSYILPNGKFLTIWRSKIPVSKYSATGSATHRDVQDFLYSKGLVKDKGIDVDDPELEKLGCIRVNGGFEEYIWLPNTRPNEEQWKSLLIWLDWYFRFHSKLMVGFKSYAPKIYSNKDYTTDEILKKCKEAYSRGYLTEYLDKLNPEDNSNYPVYITDEAYKLKNILLRDNTPYRIYDGGNFYLFQNALSDKTHYDMIDLAWKNDVFGAGTSKKTLMELQDSQQIFDDRNYIVFRPKNYEDDGRIKWYTTLGEDDYYDCRVYSFGIIYVRSADTYRLSNLINALGKPEREIFYNELDEKVYITIGDKHYELFLSDLDYELENAIYNTEEMLDELQNS